MTASPAVGAAAAGAGGMGGGGRARHECDQIDGSPGHRGDVATTVKSDIQSRARMPARCGALCGMLKNHANGV
jgi:hypothetical protein